MAELGRHDSDVEALAARVAELERIALVGSADRPLGLAEVAPAIRRSTPTVRRWLRSSKERGRRRLDLLVRRDVSGRWISTPRMIAAWRRATEAALTPPLFAPISKRRTR